MTETLNLDHTSASDKRDGQWEVPARVTLRQRMGSASLDLTDAILAAPHSDLEIDMAGGSIEIRVPAGMQVIAGLRRRWPATRTTAARTARRRPARR